ncbi:MAG: phage tail tip lysozyme, partial [Raoultibacter sp.]
EQSPGDALGAVTTLRTPGHDQRVAKHAARSSRVSRVARTQQKNEAQIAVEKHVEKVASKQAKERSVEAARKTAARSRSIQRALKSQESSSIGARISRIFFPDTSKEAMRLAGKRALTAIAGGTAAAVPFIFVGFIFFILLSGAVASEWNFEGLTEDERTVAVYLKNKGLDKVSVAAIMGNMKQESGVDPTLHQSGGGPGRGLLQWEEGSGRFSALCRLAEARGVTWENITVQLEFLWKEAPEQFDTCSPMSHTYPSGAIAGLGRYMSFEEWKEITDIAWATETWERVFTRASKPMMEQRITYARAYLALFNRGTSGNADADTVIDLAFTKIGAPYVFGASGPDEFDCSGFVKWCFEQNGISLMGARTADQIYRISTPISPADAKAGDIVVFTYGSPQLGETYGHIGIYLGDGMMIETSSPPTGVNVRPVGNNGIYGRL